MSNANCLDCLARSSCTAWLRLSATVASASVWTGTVPGRNAPTPEFYDEWDATMRQTAGRLAARDCPRYKPTPAA